MAFDSLKKKLGYAEDVTSDDPQADVSAQGWNRLGVNDFAAKATDWGGNLDKYDSMVKGAMSGNPDDNLKLAESSLGSAMGTIKSPEVHPNTAMRDLAQEYMASKQLKELPDQPYAHNDPKAGERIAEAYDQMKHDPNNPDVKKAYDALINETMDQYQALKAAGINIEKIKPGMENPYAKGSASMHEDVSKNKHLWYYPTDSGFGTVNNITDHPMLAKSSETLNGEPLAHNDIFRIVHDVFGHNKEGLPFGPRGEENAWREHGQMYSPEAMKALTSETRGQNSWVNYGPHGEANRAHPEATIYADQKAGILPEWAMLKELFQKRTGGQ